MHRDSQTRFFLRDDDVGALTPALQGFMTTFASRGLPVSYQIIPASLTPDCAQHLVDHHRQAPTLYEFAQHGLTHGMTVNGRHVNYEFGPERSYQQQLDIIQAGQTILRDMLGERFNARVFTPPQHKYDRNTLLALRDCGVTVLSASSYAGSLRHRVAYGVGRALGMSSIGRNGISYHGRVRPDSQLMELSISVPVDNGSVRMPAVAEVMAAVHAARERTPLVGLMFHHQAYAGDGDLAFLAELADQLKALPGASFDLLGGLSDELFPKPRSH